MYIQAFQEPPKPPSPSLPWAVFAHRPCMTLKAVASFPSPGDHDSPWGCLMRETMLHSETAAVSQETSKMQWVPPPQCPSQQGKQPLLHAQSSKGFGGFAGGSGQSRGLGGECRSAPVDGLVGTPGGLSWL